jgi:hypothetical protein
MPASKYNWKYNHTSAQGNRRDEIMRKIITTAVVTLLVALATPALALDYSCSPLTGGCTPRASQPSAFDSPVYRPQPRVVWPSSCPLDGPGAWSCDTRERVRRDRGR